MAKTLVVISDSHCGSIYGLTPPPWFQRQSPHHYSLQKEAWEAYREITNKWKKPDILLVNGDCIEGRQEKQGGAELLTNDRNVQVDMAVKAIKCWDARKILMVYGTKYHVGDQAEDFEFNIAKELKAEIEGRLFFEVEGMTIDARHKVSTSMIPHGRATGLLREVMWDLIREAEGEWPKVDIVIRSHSHYHLWIEQPKKIAFTTPALQLARGRFGSRELSGSTHWGAIRLTIHRGQIINKEVNLWNLIANRPKVIKIK